MPVAWPAWSGAVDDVVDLGQEERRGADERVVVLAALDDGVARLVPVELGVVEVDDDLAAREPAPAGFAVQVGGPGLHTVDRALEQAGSERVVDVGHDADADLGGRDPDLRGLRLLVARLGARRRDGDCRQADEERADHDRIADLDHWFPPWSMSPRHSYTTGPSCARGSGSAPPGVASGRAAVRPPPEPDRTIGARPQLLCRPSCRRRPRRTRVLRRATRRAGGPSPDRARSRPPGDRSAGRRRPTSSSVASTASNRRCSATGPEVVRERRGHDHEPVPLSPVPVGPLDRLAPQVSADDVVGEGTGDVRRRPRPRVRRAAARTTPSLAALRVQWSRPRSASATLRRRRTPRAVAPVPATSPQERHEVVAGRERAVEVERGDHVDAAHGCLHGRHG